VITLVDYDLVRERLTSSVISDVLDGMGVRGQAMAADIRPLSDEMKAVGRAATMLMTDQYDMEKETFTLQFQAIDSLKENDVMMVCSNGSERAALWGELLSTAARHRNANGAIIDGLVRDVQLIREMRFPVFAKGVRPTSSKGRVIAVDHGCPVEMGGVHVEQGDLVVADVDGIVVVPSSVVEAVVEKALEVVDRETMTRNELRKGVSLYDVYKKYGTV